jgi:hypothetical protein
MESERMDRPKEADHPAVSVSNGKTSHQESEKAGFVKKLLRRMNNAVIESGMSRASCPT